MDNQHKEQAYQLANIGHWELDVESGDLYWSDQVKRLHEVSLDYQPELETALAFYQEGDHRDSVQKAVNDTIKSGKSFSVESKIITAKGNSRWVNAVGEPVMKDGRCTCVYGSTQDITERKAMEQQLQQERDRISEAEQEKTRMLERIDDGFFAVDEDWIVRYWNKRAEQILGIPEDQVMSCNLWDVFQEAPELDFYDQYHTALNEQVTVHFIEHYHPQDRWLEVTAYPCEIGLSVYFRDFTEEMQSQRDLLEKQKQLQNIADNIKGSILRYRLHPDGSEKLIYASEGLKDLHEITPQQAMESPNRLWSQIADVHREGLRESIEASAENMTSWDHTFKIETPSGRQKWIHARGAPRQLEDGSVQWDTIEHDITEQKQLEEEIAQQVTLLNDILDSIPGLFYMVDENLTFTRINKNLERLFDLTIEELQETKALTLIAPRKRNKAKRLMEKAFQEGYAELETILIGGDGKEYYYYMNGSRITLDGNPYVIGSGIDITARVEAEEENTVLLREVHHRVKNNLAIISGILILEMEGMPSGSEHSLALERSVNRIHAIAKVHELLYKSSNFSRINVREYISDLAATVTNTLQAEEEEIDVQLDISEIKMNINEVIPLGMVLNELLTNSLKYAFPGQQQGLITLDISKQGKSYTVAYRDNGRGFDRKNFEESKSLGLTIVNILLKQLQAEYELDTSDGFEISFTFESREKGSHANI